MIRHERLGFALPVMVVCGGCSFGEVVRSGAARCETLLVFDAERGAASNVLVLDLQSGVQVEISADDNAHTKDWLPDLSPGGTEVVFVSEDSSGAGQLYIAESDGSELRQLTRELGAYESPAWSPHGNWIAFEWGSEEGWGLYLIRPDGTGLHRIGPGDANLFHPSWSPDGRRLAVVTGDEEGWVAAILTLESGALHLVTEPGLDVGYVNWSPDGTRIAMDGVEGENFDLYMLDLESGYVDQLTAGSAVDARPTWSPDANRLVFHSNRDGGGPVGGEGSWDEFELYLLHLTTGETQRLTDNSSFDGHPDWCGAMPGGVL